MKQLGFTLIELAIVLVIIGLVVGGVLVGRDLIYAAQIRAFVSQVESYDAAAQTFRTKYNCLPGDCINASTFGMYHDGNGNGRLEPYISDSEPMYAFAHLKFAGLVAGDFFGNGVENFPRSKIPGMATAGPAYIYLVYISQTTMFCPPCTYSTGTFTHPVAANGHFAWPTAITDAEDTTGLLTLNPMDAYLIDAKMDDGYPYSGKAWVFGDHVSDTYVLEDPTSGAGGSASNVCVSTDATPEMYNIKNISSAQCAFAVRLSF